MESLKNLAASVGEGVESLGELENATVNLLIFEDLPDCKVAIWKISA